MNAFKFILTKDLYQYNKGDIFLLVGNTRCGWDIIHNKTGHIVLDYIQYSLDFYDEKKVRKEKLNRINES